MSVDSLNSIHSASKMDDLLNNPVREKLLRALKERLCRAIDQLKDTLVRIDRDEAQSLDDITENCKRISHVLQTISDDKLEVQMLWNGPISYLLTVGPLTRTEIPIDILATLISVGFDVNEYSCGGRCLDIAVQNQHYNAIKLLVQHGAESNGGLGQRQSPITVLASQSNAPLDLFELLATQGNLNDGGAYHFLPLHNAVQSGNSKIALHLIKLGASVNREDGSSRLPIEYFVKRCTLNQFDNELFKSLFPSRNMDILKVIGGILEEKKNSDKTATYNFEMLHWSLQRLHNDESLNVEITCCLFSTCMVVNGVKIVSTMSTQLLPIFLYSLLLVELQFDLASVPNKIANNVERIAGTEGLTHACAVDTVWKDYHKHGHLKSLLRLCILQIRSCMSSLDDDSFLSLPVPPYLRKLLTYYDVVEKIFSE